MFEAQSAYRAQERKSAQVEKAKADLLTAINGFGRSDGSSQRLADAIQALIIANTHEIVEGD